MLKVPTVNLVVQLFIFQQSIYMQSGFIAQEFFGSSNLKDIDPGTRC
jgi:hypothetical protein